MPANRRVYEGKPKTFSPPVQSLYMGIAYLKKIVFIPAIFNGRQGQNAARKIQKRPKLFFNCGKYIQKSAWKYPFFCLVMKTGPPVFSKRTWKTAFKPPFLDHKSQKVNDTIAKVSFKIEKVKDEIAKVNDEIVKMKDTFAKVKDEIGKMTDTFAKVKDEIAKVNDTFVKVKDEIVKVNDTFAKVKDEIGKMNDTFAKVKDEIGKMNDTFWALEAITADIILIFEGMKEGEKEDHDNFQDCVNIFYLILS